MAEEVVAVLTALADPFLQNEVPALLAAEEVSRVVLPCHLNGRQGQMIVRDWSCCGAGRLSFSSDCFCATKGLEVLFSK